MSLLPGWLHMLAWIYFGFLVTLCWDHDYRLNATAAEDGDHELVSPLTALYGGPVKMSGVSEKEFATRRL